MRELKVLLVTGTYGLSKTLKKIIEADKELILVAEANNAYDARDKILEYKPDVMLLSHDLPRMPGISFLERLMPQFPIPTVVIAPAEQREAAYEAGAIITGGHTIKGAEPIYGLAVSGFVHPEKVLTNSGAKPGDVLILTKRLGVGILTTGAKAEMTAPDVMERVYRQMATLNKAARDVIARYPVSSCTDVTGFALIGHSYEMAQGSGCTIHLTTDTIPVYEEALELAAMGFVPAGAYRNRAFAECGVRVTRDIPLAMQDILYDPQTSGGLLIALPQAYADDCLAELRKAAPDSAIIGYVTNQQDAEILLE